MKRAFFTNPYTVLSLLLNLMFGIAVLNQIHKWLPANDPMLENGFTWITVVITAIQLAVAVAVIRSDQRRETEINRLTNKEKETHKLLTDRLQNLEQRLEEQKNEITTKDRVLKDVTEKARTYKERFESASKELTMLNLTAEDQKRALETMVYKLGFFAQMIHDQPAPVTLSGADLKNIRFEALRIAIIGFDGLEAFPWRNLSGIEPRMYRDFVHASLGEKAINPTKPWASSLILAAHAS